MDISKIQHTDCLKYEYHKNKIHNLDLKGTTDIPIKQYYSCDIVDSITLYTNSTDINVKVLCNGYLYMNCNPIIKGIIDSTAKFIDNEWVVDISSHIKSVFKLHMIPYASIILRISGNASIKVDILYWCLERNSSYSKYIRKHHTYKMYRVVEFNGSIKFSCPSKIDVVYLYSDKLLDIVEILHTSTKTVIELQQYKLQTNDYYSSVLDFIPCPKDIKNHIIYNFIKDPITLNDSIKTNVYMIDTSKYTITGIIIPDDSTIGLFYIANNYIREGIQSMLFSDVGDIFISKK